MAYTEIERVLREGESELLASAGGQGVVVTLKRALRNPRVMGREWVLAGRGEAATLGGALGEAERLLGGAAGKQALPGALDRWLAAGYSLRAHFPKPLGRFYVEVAPLANPRAVEQAEGGNLLEALEQAEGLDMVSETTAKAL